MIADYFAFNKSALPREKLIFLSIVMLYFALPTIIFLVGFVKYYFTIPAVILIIISVQQLLKQEDSIDLTVFKFSRGNLRYYVIALLLLSVWLYYSGIGGFSFQNADHHYRNTIFNILITYDWPTVAVLDSERILLCYYIGHYMPAAVLGKLFGIDFGYLALYLWSLLGLFILYMLICSFLKRLSLFAVIYLILFSGLDILFYPMEIFSTDHLEWHDICFQYASFTTGLYWAYNQVIPALLLFCFLIQCKNFHFHFFVMALGFILCPMPIMGMFLIFSLDFMFRLIKSGFSLSYIRRNLVCSDNLFPLFWFFIPLCYATSNTSGGIFNIFNIAQSYKLFSLYIIFLCLEVFVFIPLIWREIKTEHLIICALISLVICPWFRVGLNFDICMRASVPGLFVVFLFICKNYSLRLSKELFFMYAIIFAFCAIQPLHEIIRSVIITNQIDTNILYRVPDNSVFGNSNFQSKLTDENRFLIFMR